MPDLRLADDAELPLRPANFVSGLEIDAGGLHPDVSGCSPPSARSVTAGRPCVALMHKLRSWTGCLQIEDCLDADGGIVLPPGATLISLIDRNIANVGDSVAYRYLDFTRSDAGQPTEITWTRLGVRLRAIGARIQQVTARGDRVASWRHRALTTSQGSSRR